MTCVLEKDIIDKTIDFHGHACPGLAIGIRVSELAMQEFNISATQSQGSSSMVCVAETDMCGVDAIQFLTNCTFGKGNLIHKDFGKSGFTFFDREQKKGFRALFLDVKKDGQDKEARTKFIMDADLNDLFKVEKITKAPVKPAKILQSIKCEKCNEMTMESRIRRYDNKFLCIPCFMESEQKI